MTQKIFQRWGWSAAAVGVGFLCCVWAAMAALRAADIPDPAEIAAGRALFIHEWQPNDPLAAGGDGLGPVFNDRSCVACHFQSGVGGAGPNKHNVLSFEVDPTPNNPNSVMAGVVHASALEEQFSETMNSVRQKFPIVKQGEHVVGSCFVITRDFDPVRFQTVSTPALFGVGLIENIPDSAITSRMRSQQFVRLGQELRGKFDATPVGEARILSGGRIGKFGWKGQFATLEEFVATACAVEVGLTNPLRAQDKPCRYECDREAELDLDQGQFNALVEFIFHLPRPVQVVPEETEERMAVRRGEQLFAEVGCADCHTPEIGGVAGVYSDFLMHTVAIPRISGDYGRIERDLPLPSNHPKPDEWKTPPLWGVADSAPYFHDGASPTLLSAIQRHHGEAAAVRERFQHLSALEQQAVIAFLESLRAPELEPGMQIAELANESQ